MMCVTMLAGYVTLQVSMLWFSRELSNLIASWVVGTVANTYARWRNDVALSSTLAGIYVMVPGAVGAVGFYGLLKPSTPNSDQVDEASTSFAVDMSIRCMSLALGLYLSTLGFFPMPGKQKKKKFLMTM